MADNDDASSVGSRPKSALMKRHEQLQRWKGSELDKEKNHVDPKRIKVKFNQGCVFLAACASGDTDEVKKMLGKGTDINYANVDGLTALHQAVIDEKLEMVEFLVENGADIEAQDNEGWTPLHAAASCGFMDIAQFLIDNGANVAAVNNEGEIPLDLAEEEEMEEFLQNIIEKLGLDVENARNEEEQRMLTDANQWLNTKNIKEKRHPKSGATALHVASAKGYIKVMSILIQAGSNVDEIDNDGWTSLHAASHWGQKEAVELLVENMCEMNHKNKLGQTAFDLADDEMLKWLEELKKKQASLKKEEKPSAPRIEAKNPPPFKRSVPDRNMLLHQDMAKERRELELKIHGKDSEKEKPASNVRPKVASGPLRAHGEKKTMESSSSSESESESSEDDSKNRPTKNRGSLNHNKPGEVNTRQANRTPNLPQAPATPTTPPKKEVPSFSPKPLQPPRQDSKEEAAPAWRQGLRKSGSASVVPESVQKPDKEPEKLPRSSSSPKLTTTEERAKQSANERQDRLGRLTEGKQVETKPAEPKTEDKTGREFGLSSRGGSFTRRPRIIADVTTDQDKGPDTDRNTTITATITTTTTPPVTTATTTVPTTGRRSYMTPAKDEESETQRRLRAKRERSSRRSTQGVTAEDLEGAKTAIQKKTEKEDKEKDNKNEPQKDNKKEEEPARPTRRVGRVSLTSNKEESEPAQQFSGRRGQDNQSNTTATFTARPGRTGSASTDTSSTSVRTARLPSSQDTDEAKEKERRENARKERMQQEQERQKKEREKEREREKEKEKDDDDKSPKKHSTISRRRPRERRRATGVIYIDEENEDESEDSQVEDKDKLSERTADRYGSRPLSTSSIPSRYGDSSSTPSSSDRYASRTGSGSSYTRDRDRERDRDNEKTSSGTPCLNCKKLFDEQKSLVTKLQDQVKERDLEVAELKMQVEKSQQKSDRFDTKSVDNEKRERRALERRLSELEEELKAMEQLKSDNQRLKDENGALVRVISKLSK
ncbi:protein phosphatase 1 regulatory subunit 12A-like isoform X2 [Patiria miniata]|uniref:Protein phosphatase 1 regulatory subunit 12B n=1 Tax=Patiria miniata TaxID=46514 RepID=A0A914BB02_PATMI|nr:protein phosphatase 1 regulatory subunit 12A-like isoform X2 [Patiria miniata]